VVLPGVTITRASLDGQPLVADNGGTIALPPTAAPARLDIAFNL
jgi:hypothetical protein